MLGLPLVLVLLLMMGLGALARSEWALRWLVDRGVAASQGRLEVDEVSGSLLRGLHAQGLRWSDTTQEIKAESVSLSLSWRSVWSAALRIDALTIGTLTWTSRSDQAASPWPVSLRPPKDLIIERIAINRLAVALSDPALEVEVRELVMGLKHAQQAWQLQSLSLTTLSSREGQITQHTNARSPASPVVAASAAPTTRPWSVWVGPQGWLNALQAQARMESSAPYALDVRMQARPGGATHPWTVLWEKLGLTPQTELALQVFGNLETPAWQLTVPGHRMQARIEGGTLRAGRLAITNTQPGLLSAGLLPFRRLEGDWRLDSDRLWFDEFSLDGPAGTMRLNGSWRLDAKALELALASPALNLAGLSGGLAPTALQTRLRMTGTPARWRVVAEGHDPARAVSLRAQIEVAGRRLRIEQLGLSGQEGSAELAGELELPGVAIPGGALPGRALGAALMQITQDSAWQLRGRFDRMNLGRWIAQWPAWPLSGPFELRHHPDDSLIANARLQWGPARLRVEARKGPVAAVQARIEGVPAAQFWPGAQGLLQADLDLTGRWPGMAAVLRVQARDTSLAVQGEMLSARSAGLEVSVQNLRSAVWQVRGLATEQATGFRLGVSASGLSARDLKLSRVQAVFEGRSTDQQNQEGMLLSLEASGERGRLLLTSPVSLRRTAQAVQIATSTWQLRSNQADSAELVLERLDWGEQGAQLMARIDALPITVFAAWLEPWLATGAVETQGPQALVMRALLELHLPASLRWSEARGRFELARRSGDLRVTPGGQGESIVAGLNKTDLLMQLSGGDLELRWALEGRTLGRIQGEARVKQALRDTGLDREASVQGMLLAELPSLAVARVFTGEAWQIDGALQADLRLGGTLGAPRWSGAITGRDLMAVQQALGMRLDRGLLRASLLDNRIDIEQLSFQSGQGRVTMSGVLRADERSEARILLERLPIPLGAAQRLVLSGQAQARLGRDGLFLTGQLRADEGAIEISSASTPSLAPDIRVRAAGAPSGVRTASSGPAGSPADGTNPLTAERGGSPRGLRVHADLQVDLGDQLRVHGGGLETRLAGQLRLSGPLPDAMRVEGTVQTRAGLWRGFGQDLQIERGTLVFTGDLEDPAIDVVAWRRFQPVQAGVELSGTARRPMLTLVSTPEVPDPDKLSWLVLGTAFDSTRGGQNAALQAAAAVLVAGTDAASPIRSLASNFGLDLLTLRTAPAGASDASAAGSFAQDSIVTLGKRLTERLFLTYEQSLRGLQNLFRLQYQINERLNLRARAGSQTGVDLIWSRRYD